MKKQNFKNLVKQKKWEKDRNRGHTPGETQMVNKYKVYVKPHK